MSPRWARALVVCFVASGASCTKPLITETPTVEAADDQVATCKVAKDPLNPMVVEWPGTSKVDLEAASQQNVVIVSYKGCALKVLTGCTAKGKYDFVGTTPTRDEIVIGTNTDLYAQLPLGAAALKGELASGSSLRLEYVAVGQRVAKAPSNLRGDCEGATHFVRSITVGAYQLDVQAGTAVGVGADVGPAGAGAKRREDVRRLRGAGDVSTCTASKAKGECGAVLQLGLVALPEGGEAPASDGDDEAPASGVAGSPKGGSDAMAYIQAQKKGYKLRESAMQKYNAGDAAGCLAALDQADKIDPDAKDEAYAQSNRAYCELLAGRCAAGKKRLTAWFKKYAGPDPNLEKQVANAVETFSKGKCK